MVTEMDSNRQHGEPPSKSPSGGRKRRRWLRVLLLVAGTLTVLVLLAPRILSTVPVRGWILAAANRRIDGQLEIESYSLSWTGPIRATGIRFRDEDGKEIVQLSQVEYADGLLGVLVDFKEFKRLSLSRGQISLYLEEDEEGGFSWRRLGRRKRPKKTKRPEPLSLPALTGTLAIDDVQIVVYRPDGQAFRLAGLRATVDLEAAGRIKGSFVATVGDGEFSATFDVADFLSDGLVDLEKATGQFHLTTNQPMDIGPFAEFFADEKNLAGALSMDVKADKSGRKASGLLSVSLTGLQLASPDRTEIRPLNVTYASSVTKVAQSIVGEASLSSEAGTMEAKFDYRNVPEVSLPGLAELVDAILTERAVEFPQFSLGLDGTVDLARLAGAMPAAMGVLPDVEVTSGTFAIRQVRISGGKEPSVSGSIALSDLLARKGDKTLACEPVSIAFDASIPQAGGMTVDRLAVESSFARLTGRGNPQEFSADGRADLEKFHEQFGRIFDIHPALRKGVIAGEAHLRRPNSGRVDIALDATVRGWRYPREDGSLLEIDRASLRYSGYVLLDGRKVSKVVVTETAIGLGGLGEKLQLAGAGWYDRKTDAFEATGNLQKADLAGLSQWLTLMVPDEVLELSGHLSGRFAAQRDEAGLVRASLQDWSCRALRATISGPDEQITASLDRADFELAATASPVQQDANESPAHMVVYSFSTSWSQGRVERKGRSAKFDSSSIQVRGTARLDKGKPVRVELTEAGIHVDEQLHVMASGWMDVNNESFAAELNLLGAELAPLRQWANVYRAEWSEKQDVAGRLSGTASLSRKGAGQAIRSEGTARLADLSVDGNALSDAPIAVTWTGLEFQPAGPQVDLQLLTVTGDVGGIDAEKVRVTLDEPFQASGELRIEADIAKAISVASLFTDWDKPPGIAGTLNWSGRAQSEDRVVRITGDGRVVGFSVEGEDGKSFQQDEIQFSQVVDVDEENQRIVIRNFDLNSEILAFQIAGTVDDYRRTRILDLKGSYEGSWEKITLLLHKLAPKSEGQIALTGKAAGAVVITGPARQPDVRPTFRDMTATTELGWGQINALGVIIEQAKIALALREGQVTIAETVVGASGGKVRLAGVVDLREDEPVYRLSKKTKLLESLRITPEISRKLLSRFNPIFSELTTIDGEVSLETEGLFLPLGKQFETLGRGKGHLDLSKLKVKPEGLLAMLVSFSGLTAGEKTPMQMRGMDFEIRDGRIHYDNFALVFGDQFDLRFFGSVGFDDTLDLAVSVPISAPLLEQLGAKGPLAEYARLLDGVRVVIPLKGTRDKATPDLGKVDYKPLIAKAVEAFLGQQARKALEDILKGGIKREKSPDPNKPGRKDENKVYKSPLSDLLDLLGDRKDKKDANRPRQLPR